MGHVDSLICHVSAITRETPLDRQNVCLEQAKDAFSSKETPGAYRSKHEYFWDSDGVMYKRRSNGNHQVVLPKTLVPDVIKGTMTQCRLHAPV
jgi:hypothetical protein